MPLTCEGTVVFYFIFYLNSFEMEMDKSSPANIVTFVE